MMTLTERQFDEYTSRGYFRGIKYRWSKEGSDYIVYISQSSYNNFMQNMESKGWDLIKT